VLIGLLRDRLRIDERVLAAKVFPDGEAVAPMAGWWGRRNPYGVHSLIAHDSAL
jgi:hypothetical protein